MVRRPEHERPRVAVLTLGCPKNLVDSELIASLLDSAGVEVCTDVASARVAIVNTCGFIDAAKEESVDAVLDVSELKKSAGLEALIVTGCLSQRYGSELRHALPEVDAVLGIDPRGAARAALLALEIGGPLPSRCTERTRRLTPTAWSYLKIAEGCDNRCAYCAIPSIRGPLVSRPMDEIVCEARHLFEGGVTELNMIAQDTTAYGMDRGARQLHLLLRRLCALEQGKWVRLLYTHPAHYYPELIDVLACEPELCPYLDIPLQHINDRILHRMGRKVRRRDIERLIETLRERIPGLTLRTTFMVGFPGETDGDFQELLDFVKAARFDRLGAFTYSQEEGTRAENFDEQVPQQVKEARFHALMTAQREIACGLAAEREGEQTMALIEIAAASDGGPAMGRSPHEAPDVDPVILVEDGLELQCGDVVGVEIIGSAGYDCIARPTGRAGGDGR